MAYKLTYLKSTLFTELIHNKKLINMKSNPAKEKIINNQDDHGTGQIDAKIMEAENAKKKSDGIKKPTFTSDDLKGKKVDGDPALESDQPVEQVVNKW